MTWIIQTLGIGPGKEVPLNRIPLPHKPVWCSRFDWQRKSGDVSGLAILREGLQSWGQLVTLPSR